MKKKINGSFMLIAALAIIFTTLVITLVYYQVFQKEIFADLKNVSCVLQETELIENDNAAHYEKYEEDMVGFRITLVASDGEVKYDNVIGDRLYENHRDRPEIADAIKYGSGRSIRTSSTIDKSNYYYAVRLENGDILRVAKETESIVKLFLSVVPVILFIVLILFAVCIIISHYLTKSLVTPVEQMAENLDHLERVKTYKELMPFVDIIKQQHEDILKASRLRQEFTANVSHELKTPLTSISGYSELIENGMVSDGDVQRFAGEIHGNAKRLISLINDIIELSELDAGNENSVKLENVDLYELAENCVVMLAPVAEKRNITFHLDGERTIAHVNRELMNEVIYNLCDNAIRYNQEGGNVWIHIADGFSVRDDGIGIPKEHQERIFERFYRVDKSRSKKTGGTGLGLAIVKHIVELHNGSITVESEPQKGTTIRVEL